MLTKDQQFFIITKLSKHVKKIKELDLELFKKACNGNEQAFTTFFNNYYEQLYRFAGRFIKDSDAAENIIQNMFVYIWVRRTNINVEQNVKAYLYTSVRNQCINFLKKSKRTFNLNMNTEVQIESIKSPEENLIKDEMFTAVHNAIERLPEKCRRIYLMKKYDELSYKEIAEILGISINTVKTQMKRALKSLLKQLENLSSIIMFL